MERNLAGSYSVNYHGYQPYSVWVEHTVLEFSKLQIRNITTLSCFDRVDLECSGPVLIMGVVESKKMGAQADGSGWAYICSILLVGPYFLNGPSGERSDRYTPSYTAILCRSDRGLSDIHGLDVRTGES